MSTFLDQLVATNEGSVPELTLGWRLQMALRQAGMTTQQMADDLEVGRNTISRWINDHGAQPKRVYVLQWALRTGVDSDWLLTGQQKSHRPDGPTDDELCTARDSNPEPAGLQLPRTKVVSLERRRQDRTLVARAS